MAEILSVKSRGNDTMYYVHFIDYNKRLDEWVSEDRLDLTNIQMPKKEAVKGVLKNGSRSSSPDRENVIWF